jgi:cytochrome P450
VSLVALSDPWRDPELVRDPYPFYARLRKDFPVWLVPGTRTHFVASWKLVVEAVARTDDFSSNLTGVLIRGADGGPAELTMIAVGEAGRVLATADEPDHGPQRRLVVPHLTARRLRRLESELDRISALLWEDSVLGGDVEMMSAIGDRLPMTLVAEVIGLPDDDVPRLIAWSYAGSDLLTGLLTADEMAVLGASALALAEYLQQRVVEAERNPGEDLLGDFARAISRGEMTEAQAVAALVILVGAGGESTAGLIGNAAHILAQDGELQLRLRHSPELLPRFLDEVLRLESPFRGHYRHVRRPTTLGGVDLAQDDHLVLLWGSANRDESEFDGADQLRLDRVGSKHLAFGRGIHFCVGAPLARLEAHSAVAQLLSR